MKPNPDLLHLLMPVAILIAAQVLLPHVAALPASLAGLREHGPYFVIAIGVAISIAFQRGRALFALLTLAAAQMARQLYLQTGSPPSAAYTAFAAVCLFVPLNLAVLSALQERGIFNRHGVQRAALVLVQLVFCLWLPRWGRTGFASAVYVTVMETRLFASSPIPQLGLLAIALALAVSLVVWLHRRAPLDLGFAGAILAFALAANSVSPATTAAPKPPVERPLVEPAPSRAAASPSSASTRSGVRHVPAALVRSTPTLPSSQPAPAQALTPKRLPGGILDQEQAPF